MSFRTEVEIEKLNDGVEFQLRVELMFMEASEEDIKMPPMVTVAQQAAGGAANVEHI